MTEAATRERLSELLDMIVSFAPLGRKVSADSADSAYDLSLARGGQSVESVIDALRVQIKYLLFDLEATRRENRYLRQMLENRPPADGGACGDNGSGPH